MIFSSWKRKDLRQGVPVTVTYPFTDTEKPPEYRGIPHINPELCIGCGACVRACPPDALSIEWDFENGKKRIVFNAARCIRCHRCVEVCPTEAMEETTRFEIATDNKEDLIEVVEHDLYRCPRCGRYEEFTERQIYKMLQILPKEIFDESSLLERVLLCRECRMREEVDRVRGGGNEV
ncbi:NADH-quinone oxidoreductase subunit I [Pyrococcus kukulkanii]|uniref:Hydrogenase n=1 Tax=Pyrococcus kukulkanii TaxID=1609559 RepID=A0A127B9P6_9EURY|nr:NADH-quinone oxidoreductase subunit I [Pyrococcus kukulkanii]AMM53945.1 hydrogenase [Pyrococcus kukulkanii]